MKMSVFWDITPYSPLKQPTFQRNMSPPSSASKNKPSKKQGEVGSKQGLIILHITVYSYYCKTKGEVKLHHATVFVVLQSLYAIFMNFTCAVRSRELLDTRFNNRNIRLPFSQYLIAS
jgi:hypothetical protein